MMASNPIQTVGRSGLQSSGFEKLCVSEGYEEEKDLLGDLNGVRGKQLKRVRETHSDARLSDKFPASITPSGSSPDGCTSSFDPLRR